MATNIVHNTETSARQASSTAGSRTQIGASSAEITPERIQERAYFIFLSRAGGSGSAESDWVQAEKELQAEGLRRSPNPQDRAGRSLPRTPAAAPSGAGNAAFAAGSSGRNPVLFSGG
ncbi:MAG: DUF2934 domain-containing protein [Phycisphaeraceae bacterium]|nr:DUF2934 domain-containing protein [Phycisphaeraceae bacterium]